MSGDGKKTAEAVSEVEAVIIDEGQHPIQEKDIDKEALKVLYRLRDAGFAGYLVGGGVRDLYLGNTPKDFDISTNAHPGQLRKLFRNSRTIGRRFRLVQVFFHGNKIIEVSTLRCKSEYDINDPEQVLPSNNTFGTLEEDAFRRDLTINSLFYEIENKTIIDYVGGVEDLEKGIIRIVGEPERRITRDPVRMLRAIRHAARNDFAIDDLTWQAIKDNRQKLDLCPPSRIRDELLKDLQGGCSTRWAQVALKCKVFSTLFPFYGELINNGSLDFEKEVLALLAVLDRLYEQSNQDRQVVFADYMLFAVVLFPWMNKKFDLIHQQLKGPGYHRLSKAIRLELNTLFSHRLNLKRMAKDAMTTMFVNMSTFAKHQEENSWPASLRRKSYFKDCARFFSIWQEANCGKEADVLLFSHPRKSNKVPLLKQASGKGKSRGRRGTSPAFSSSSAGVFGLRKG